MNDALLVTLVNDILIVGRKELNQSVTIVNAFQGEEAIDIYQKLITKKGESDAEIPQ